ncbi:MAG: hypothetical protein HQL52_17485 [Magnetococcales bacterium]|nr:hypothetical protein [Magnetococcales bacterium]
MSVRLGPFRRLKSFQFPGVFDVVLCIVERSSWYTDEDDGTQRFDEDLDEFRAYYQTTGYGPTKFGVIKPEEPVEEGETVPSILPSNRSMPSEVKLFQASYPPTFSEYWSAIENLAGDVSDGTPVNVIIIARKYNTDFLDASYDALFAHLAQQWPDTAVYEADELSWGKWVFAMRMAYLPVMRSHWP